MWASRVKVKRPILRIPTYGISKRQMEFAYARMILLLEPFLVALAVTLVSVPLLARLATRLAIIDRPGSGAHKTHGRPIPYLGGVAFHLAFTAVLLDIYWRYPALIWSEEWAFRLLALYAASGVMLIVGIADDVLGLRAGSKLLLQLIVVGALVQSGFTIERLTNPLTGTSMELGWIGAIVAALWMIGLVNAVNLIDGLDGLAAGVSASAAAALVVIALNPWHGFAALTGVILLGATLGFLPYNLPPARIFMGDAGSLYLGLLLGAASIESTTKSATMLAMAIPLVALLVPILDTGLAVIRRSARGRHPFRGDREHLHHRLLNLGLTPTQATWTLIGLAALCSLLSVIASRLAPRLLLVMLATLVAALIWGLWVFSALERRVAEKNGANRDENGER